MQEEIASGGPGFDTVEKDTRPTQPAAAYSTPRHRSPRLRRGYRRGVSARCYGIKPDALMSQATSLYNHGKGLMRVDTHYSEIVRQCFSRGEPDWEAWDDYPALGFAPVHIPELIHILENRAEIWEQAGEGDRIEWAP